MAKQLVTVDNLDEFLCANDGRFYMDGSRILTPGAKDALAARKVEIVFGPGCGHAGQSCAQANGGCACAQGSEGKCACAAPEDEEILIAVAATLQKEYNITDPAELRAMSLEMVKTLKENLSVY
ncbi:hypothetical protein LJC46_05360 [Desulfovibrio sp. OttesenSCG-928-G15]|nr:hypothetical protein [Desulfovibrio sp. OttesenSCG-928-G15]